MNNTEIKTCCLCGATSHENSSCPLAIENLIKAAKWDEVETIASNAFLSKNKLGETMK